MAGKTNFKMDYVGINPVIGLECSSCPNVERIPYTILLSKVFEDHNVTCSGCNKNLNADGTTIETVNEVIKQRMRDAAAAKYDKWRGIKKTPEIR